MDSPMMKSELEKLVEGTDELKRLRALVDAQDAMLKQADVRERGLLVRERQLLHTVKKLHEREVYLSVATRNITARDEAANAALAAMLPLFAMTKLKAKMSVSDVEGDGDTSAATSTMTLQHGDINYDEVATESYLVADAMMRARERRVPSASEMAKEHGEEKPREEKL